MTDLARQLAAHPRWRWEPGMGVTALSEDSRTPVTGIYLTGNDVAVEDDVWAVDVTTLRPDIHNPATQGHLMASIWKRNHKAHTYCNAGWWWVMFTRADGATPGEAIAKAWLETWGAA